MSERFDKVYGMFCWIGEVLLLIANAALDLAVIITFPLWVGPYVFFMSKQTDNDAEVERQ